MKFCTMLLWQNILRAEERASLISRGFNNDLYRWVGQVLNLGRETGDGANLCLMQQGYMVFLLSYPNGSCLVVFCFFPFLEGTNKGDKLEEMYSHKCQLMFYHSSFIADLW